MSDDEIEAYNNARGGRTHRELLLGSVGIDVEPRPLGRPRFKYGKESKPRGFKFGKDLKQRSIKCRNCGFPFKSDAPLHGSICPRCSYNSIEVGKPDWRTLTCSRCGNQYETSRLGAGSSFCWRCEVLVKEVKPFRWTKPKSTGPRQDTLTGEEAQGQAASMTESKRAQMYFSIPEDEWGRLSEEEKEDYISRLPPKKKRAGGEEMSERDFATKHLRNTSRRDFNKDAMKDQSERIERKVSRRSV